jgi:hypothetical protein
MDKAKALSRLRTIEGHIRGIVRMMDEGAYCIDLLHQTSAVQSWKAIFRPASSRLSRRGVILGKSESFGSSWISLWRQPDARWVNVRRQRRERSWNG